MTALGYGGAAKWKWSGGGPLSLKFPMLLDLKITVMRKVCHVTNSRQISLNQFFSTKKYEKIIIFQKNEKIYFFKNRKLVLHCV